MYLAARCCCRWPNTRKHDGARSELQGECSNTSKYFCAKWLLYVAFQTALTREGSSVSQWLAMGWMTGLPPHKQRRVYLTNSMEQRPSWKANSSLASQEIPRIFWNLHVHYCAHKSPPLVTYPEPDKYSLWPPIPFYFSLPNSGWLHISWGLLLSE